MLQNWFILLPELCMLAFFLVAWPVDLFRREKTAKTFFTLAQFFLLAVICCTILFYNKSVFPRYWQNTPLTTLFKTFVYLLSWAWFYLSSKWFLTKNRPSFKFYAICFMLLFGFDILASASSLLTLGLAVPFVCAGCYGLIRRHWDIDRVREVSAAYVWTALFFCLLLWGGIGIIYNQTGSFEYAAVKSFFAAEPGGTVSLAGVLLILAPLMFMMALVPFHAWFMAFVSVGVLPVCGFMTLIPPLIYICTLVNLMRGCLPSFIETTAPFLTIFAVLSLTVGALSANRENNLRRLFAFLGIYCQGFALTGLIGFSGDDIMAAFAYIVVAILSFTGIYTVFLSLKRRSEYLSELETVSGFSRGRPYISAALLVFMLSLTGLAPTLGFFGCLSVISGLAENDAWGKIALLLVSQLFVANACLQVIRTLFFATSDNKFDRTDKAIYICLFINVIVIVAALINPAWLLRDALVILGGLS